MEFDEPKMTDVTKEKDEKKEVGYEEELARTFPEGISKTIAETFPWMRDSKLEIIEASLMTEDEFSMKVVDNFGQTFMISAFFRDEESTEIRSVDIYEMPKDVQLGDMWDNVYDGEPEDVPAAGCFTSNEELRKFFSVPDLVDYEK